MSQPCCWTYRKDKDGVFAPSVSLFRRWPRLFQRLMSVSITCSLYVSADTKGASAPLAILQRHTTCETSPNSQRCSRLRRRGMTGVFPLFSTNMKASHEPPRWSTNKSHQTVSCHKTSPERIWNALITVQTNHRDREYCGDKWWKNQSR